MLVLVDLSAGTILLPVELSLFALGQMTIVSSHVSFLLVINMLFAIFQMRGLPGRERTVLFPVRDAILLILLAAIHFVNTRMARIILPRSGAGCVVLGLSSGASY
jgi:hypothetical protein